MPGLALSNLPVERGLAKIDLTLEMVELPGGISRLFRVQHRPVRGADRRPHGRTLPGLAGCRPGGARPGRGRAAASCPRRRSGRSSSTGTAAPRTFPADHGPPGRVARRNPDAPAVLFGGERLTHGELHRRANRLARHLRKLGVGPEMSVGLCVERSLEMPLALLAVLKAGGAWVPLDPEYPQERLALMIEDTAMPVLLTQAHLVDRLPPANRANGHGPALICIDRLDLSGEDDRRSGLGDPSREPGLHRLHLGLHGPAQGGRRAPPVVRQPRGHLRGALPPGAGRPGAAVHLDQLRHHFRGDLPDLAHGRRRGAPSPGPVPLLRRARRDDRRATASPPSTCPRPTGTSGWARWPGPGPRRPAAAPGGHRHGAGPPRAGGGLAGAGWRRTDGRVSTTATPRPRPRSPPWSTSRASRTSHASAPATGCRWARTSRTAAPTCSTPAWSRCRSGCRATSTSPAPTSRAGTPTGRTAQPRASCPIPSPRRWATARASACTARGTSAAGCPRATSNTSAAGTIRSRSAASASSRPRWGPCWPAIRRSRTASCWSASDGPEGKRLVGYVDAGPRHSRPPSSELRDFLRESLPDHMVPAALVVMDALPLTSNGRVDRRALPEPAGDRRRRGAYVPPQTAAEEILEGIWCEVLGTARAGSNDDFFDLGGHSLLGTQVVSRVRERFRVEVPLRASCSRTRPSPGSRAGSRRSGAAESGTAAAAHRAHPAETSRWSCRSPSSASGSWTSWSRDGRPTTSPWPCISRAPWTPERSPWP